NLLLSGVTQTGPQIDTATPVVSAIAETPSSGSLNAGKIVAYTITMSEAVTVNTAGGSPTLTLNDGGVATYSGGSGSNALTFSYTVLAGQNTPDLMVSGFNLNGATIVDGAGNAANLSLTGIAQGSPSIDTTTPTVASVVASGTGITAGAGDLPAGSVVTLTVNLNSAVTVSGGVPKLTLNDGGTATYASGSGTSALTFTYTVAAGQNTPDLMVTAVNLPTGVTITSGGAAANLSLSSLTQSSPQIDTTTPAAPVISSDSVSGNIVTLKGTAAANSTITVFDNSTKLGAATANSSGTLASGSQSFTATATDAAANASLLSSARVVTLAATSPPTITKISDSPATGAQNAGKTVTLTLAFSSAVTVVGKPTLTLNDGGTATYASGSGTT